MAGDLSPQRKHQVIYNQTVIERESEKGNNWRITSFDISLWDPTWIALWLEIVVVGENEREISDQDSSKVKHQLSGFLKTNLLKTIWIREHSSVVEHSIADREVTGSILVVPIGMEFSTVQFISTFSYQSRHNIQLKQINLTIPFGRP